MAADRHQCDGRLVWVSRADDFYPRIDASHTFHLAACAYNGLFIGPLLLPDWVLLSSFPPPSPPCPPAPRPPSSCIP